MKWDSPNTALLGTLILSVIACIAIMSVSGADVTVTGTATSRRTVLSLYDYYTANLSCATGIPTSGVTSSTPIVVHPFKFGVIQFVSGTNEAYTGVIGSSVSLRVAGSAKIGATTAEMAPLQIVPLFGSPTMTLADLVTGVTKVTEMGSYLIPLGGLHRIAIQIHSPYPKLASATFYLSCQ